MNSSKKIFAFTLVFIMVFSILILPAYAEESGSFTISYTQPTGATVSLSPEDEYTETSGVRTYTYTSGTAVTLTVNAESGYELSSIKANGMSLSGVSGQSFSRTFSDDLNINFTITTNESSTQKATITVNQSDLFSYTLVGADSNNMADIGSTVNLKITPDEGYSVTQILYNSSTVPATNNYSFTVGETNNFIITVSEDVVVVQKTLSVSVVGEGTVTPNGGSFDVGSSVQLSFSANTGYILSSVFVNGTEVQVSGNKYTFNINEDTTVTVTFTKSITITANVGTGGSILINGKTLSSGSTVKVAEGSNVTVKLSPAFGYTITYLKIDGSVVSLDGENSYTISSISKSTSLTAAYEPTSAKQYIVISSAGPNGTITPEGNNTVEEGKDITFAFLPNDGYVIDTVKVNDAVVSISNSSYKIVGVAGNMNISVTFKKDTSNEPISVEDITNWDSETITIDIKNTTKVLPEVFDKITNDCKDKIVIFAANDYKWTLPRGANISTSLEFGELAVIFNGGSNYNSIVSLINDKVQSLDYKTVSYNKSVNFPANTVLSISMGTAYINQNIQQLIYVASENKLINPQNASEADIHTVASNGWVSFNYNNDSDIILCEVLEGYYTIAASASTGGIINPSGNRSVITGDDCSFEITASEGYVISSLQVDGAEVAAAEGKATYTHTFPAVSTDHSINATFLLIDEYNDLDDSGNPTLIVSIIIIILAFAGFATLLIIKWRQEKY
ncbi:MAG: hypothetical protein A2Y15_00875 [Clostridiales bacterium GWF2_36_10]|nr:MAG: hypothetical protein A2Y15_00875 [Clostridiales bacterium GWF2_36_10]